VEYEFQGTCVAQHPSGLTDEVVASPAHPGCRWVCLLSVCELYPCGFPDRRSRETDAGIRPHMHDQFVVNVRDRSIGWKMLVLV